MKATGIVVEYNPFHNGHLHHLNQSRQKTNCEVVIAVMSGNFLQRGEPALVDKWSRTKMALKAGVDIVIELPYAFATAQATDFAKGAILLLDAMKCESFCFGSEEGTLNAFQHTYSLLSSKKEEYNTAISNFMKQGVSYPKALNEAYKLVSLESTQPLLDLTQPNNILGYHYLEATKLFNTSIQPETIQRIVANYHEDAQVDETIASATGIRKLILDNQRLEEVQKFLPESSFQQLTEWTNTHHTFGSWDRFWPLLRFTILRHSKEQLANYAEVTEGMENAIWNAAVKCEQFETFMHTIKSKRYTWTRIQRMLTHIFTGFTWEQLAEVNFPTYLRPLGMSKNGQTYLNSIKKDLQLPLVSRVAASKDPLLQMDIKAANLYYAGLQSTISHQMIGSDYSTKPIIY